MMTKVSTPYSLSDYGTISFAGLPNYQFYCRMYEDNFITIYSQLSVSADTWGSADFFIFPVGIKTNALFLPKDNSFGRSLILHYKFFALTIKKQCVAAS